MLRERVIEHVKFEGKGDFVEGHLLKIQRVKFQDSHKTGLKYLVASTEGGKLVTFNGSAHINQLIFVADIGKLIRVTYISDDVEAGRGQNAMKVFTVEVDDGDKVAVEPQANGDAITDDDIPF